MKGNTVAYNEWFDVRRKSGIGVGTIAAELGISPSTLWRRLNGEIETSQEALLAAAAIDEGIAPYGTSSKH